MTFFKKDKLFLVLDYQSYVNNLKSSKECLQKWSLSTTQVMDLVILA